MSEYERLNLKEGCDNLEFYGENNIFNEIEEAVGKTKEALSNISSDGMNEIYSTLISDMALECSKTVCDRKESDFTLGNDVSAIPVEIHHTEADVKDGYVSYISEDTPQNKRLDFLKGKSMMDLKLARKNFRGPSLTFTEFDEFIVVLDTIKTGTAFKYPSNKPKYGSPKVYGKTCAMDVFTSPNHLITISDGKQNSPLSTISTNDFPKDYNGQIDTMENKNVNKIKAMDAEEVFHENTNETLVQKLHLGSSLTKTENSILFPGIIPLQNSHLPCANSKMESNNSFKREIDCISHTPEKIYFNEEFNENHDLSYVENYIPYKSIVDEIPEELKELNHTITGSNEPTAYLETAVSAEMETSDSQYSISNKTNENVSSFDNFKSYNLSMNNNFQNCFTKDNSICESAEKAIDSSQNQINDSSSNCDNSNSNNSIILIKNMSKDSCNKSVNKFSNIEEHFFNLKNDSNIINDNYVNTVNFQNFNEISKQSFTNTSDVLSNLHSNENFIPSSNKDLETINMTNLGEYPLNHTKIIDCYDDKDKICDSQLCFSENSYNTENNNQLGKHFPVHLSNHNEYIHGQHFRNNFDTELSYLRDSSIEKLKDINTFEEIKNNLDSNINKFATNQNSKLTFHSDSSIKTLSSQSPTTPTKQFLELPHINSEIGKRPQSFIDDSIDINSKNKYQPFIDLDFITNSNSNTSHNNNYFTNNQNCTITSKNYETDASNTSEINIESSKISSNDSSVAPFLNPSTPNQKQMENDILFRENDDTVNEPKQYLFGDKTEQDLRSNSNKLLSVADNLSSKNSLETNNTDFQQQRNALKQFVPTEFQEPFDEVSSLNYNIPSTVQERLVNVLDKPAVCTDTFSNQNKLGFLEMHQSDIIKETSSVDQNVQKLFEQEENNCLSEKDSNLTIEEDADLKQDENTTISEAAFNNKHCTNHKIDNSFKSSDCDDDNSIITIENATETDSQYVTRNNGKRLAEDSVADNKPSKRASNVSATLTNQINIIENEFIVNKEQSIEKSVNNKSLSEVELATADEEKAINDAAIKPALTDFAIVADNQISTVKVAFNNSEMLTEARVVGSNTDTEIPTKTTASAVQATVRTNSKKRPAESSISNIEAIKRARLLKDKDESKPSTSKSTLAANDYRDEKEIADNNDPKWQLYNFSEPQDCFLAVFNQWSTDTTMPNPHENLSRQFYRARPTCKIPDFRILGDKAIENIECISIYSQQLDDINKQSINLKYQLDIHGQNWTRRQIKHALDKLQELDHKHDQLTQAWDEAYRFYKFYIHPQTGYNAWYISEYKRNEIYRQIDMLRSYEQFYGHT